MLTIRNVPCGLSFKDWQDVYHTVPDGSEIGSHLRDGLTEEDERYLDLEAVTRGVETQLQCGVKLWNEPMSKLVKQSRGVGNWQEPKIAVVCLEVASKCGEGSPLWDGLFKHHRLRPFSNTPKSRKFITKLIEHSKLKCTEVYLTSAKKDWLTESESIACLDTEIKFIRAQKVIALGSETFELLKKFTPCTPLYLGRPEFWTKWHAPAWREYRDQFRRLIT